MRDACGIGLLSETQTNLGKLGEDLRDRARRFPLVTGMNL